MCELWVDVGVGFTPGPLGGAKGLLPRRRNERLETGPVPLLCMQPMVVRKSSMYYYSVHTLVFSCWGLNMCVDADITALGWICDKVG